MKQLLLELKVEYSSIYSKTDLHSGNLEQHCQNVVSSEDFHRSRSCVSLSLVLRETDSQSGFRSQSRPDSFASLPGRSIDSSRGSWDLETR